MKAIGPVYVEKLKVYISDIQHSLYAFVSEHHQEDDDDNTDLVITFDEDVTDNPVRIYLNGHGGLEIEFVDADGNPQIHPLT